MTGDDAYRIRSGLAIPRHEVWFEFSHASGPGGQNVNKVATAATLCFHPESSRALTPAQKSLIRSRLANRVNSDGILKIASEEARTQAANRTLAGRRFCLFLAEALTPAKKRAPTRPTRASRERRLAGKRLQAERKAERRRGKDETG